MRSQLRSWFGVLALALAASASLPQAMHAQPFPSRQVTFVVPNLAGGSSDLIARAVASHLSKVWGQPVVIDNKPGASEMIATEFLARSAPDGYTIAIFSNALSINETLSPARRYDAKRDLSPVTKLAELPFALIVAAPMPVNTLKEFVEYAKSNTTKLSYGHVGVGAPHYLTMEWFKREAGIDLLAVPYRSSPPVYTGLLGGEIQVTVGALGGATQLIESGKGQGTRRDVEAEAGVAAEPADGFGIRLQGIRPCPMDGRVPAGKRSGRYRAQARDRYS